MISTGSAAIDSLLGGGIHPGMITDIYGESGSGKSQICFTLCANCTTSGGKVVFVDTAGTFRPERIVEIGSRSTLDKIKFVRALSTSDQISTISKIQDIDPQLVIFDTLTSLFSVEYSGSARHLAVMKHLHRLALMAISSGCAVVVTNMIRTSSPITVVDQAGHNLSKAMVPSHQREYLGSSVSLYSHMKLRLEIIDGAKSLFRAILIQPTGKEPMQYTITSKGVSDIV
jgi:DNA repair protein RAD51